MKLLQMVLFGLLVPALLLAGQEQPASTGESSRPERHYTVEPGTRIPLSMVNSVSTKHSAEGDRIYLRTVFPILADGRIVIPAGSYVAGTVTRVTRPGRLRGRGELHVRFDSLTFENGVTRDFRARIGSLDGRASEDLDKQEGAIRSEGGKGSDAMKVGEATAAGASVGAISGSVAGRPGMGAGIGAAAGAAGGLATVLFTRGPEAVLAPGTTLEMVLDRPLIYAESELEEPRKSRRSEPAADGGDGPLPARKPVNVPMPGRRLGQ